MKIQLTSNDKGGTFYLISDEGKPVGEMTFVMADHKMIIDHTAIYPEFEGHGLGKQLVHAGVQFARERDMKILPLCPFAKRVMFQKPGYADVLTS